ncbi:sigma-70 region 4 domain-containing protein [Lysinibacillus sp. KU-BSD001]|uniref:sigma-70 region 4 domain-containing protein n=1 Tax=Lysinibacillus sp. KU-BSD001 TaxID=3141328 RepID=UPI0036E22FC7
MRDQQDFKLALYNFMQTTNKQDFAPLELDRTLFPALDILFDVSDSREKVNVNSARSLLTERQLTAFTMYYTGSTYAAIAEKMDISSSSVQSHIHRARKALEHLKEG